MTDSPLVLVGANPALLLRDGGASTAFASLWLVEWSPLGPGRALFVVEPGSVRAYAEHADLAQWLGSEFVRHFGEVAELGWSPPELTMTSVEVELDTTRGLTAAAGATRLLLTGVGPGEPFRRDRLPLGGASYGLSNVTFPCSAGRLELGDRTVPGEPAQAFLALAEVWVRAEDKADRS